MLDNGTKRRIDNARDILVGKIPDPKTQVEQITFALLYKFMDDMDQLAISMDGKASFFSNGYEQYAWSHLMDKRLSGMERLDLYVRALDQMSQNPNIPPLFRNIFKGAFLPYRDSETLNLFLKEINEFSYTHSEDLGDAYEYLLSIFGSQGAAGQFRTPRHIIDFIVECVDPDKNDTILDPACGTAGFLISAYKHILKKYKDTPLTPDEKERLTNNFTGYDISPDMVRLSLMNMYLHQFPNPTIFEYDTLTTDDRWDDNFDVIMANPPFMTPKGGIRPHKRFAVRANRSEVLFVDYIAEHLKPGGRAGVIVPEGIIFQTNNAYKALRKMLVEENYLYAVISLPAGVFKPYSGVKTSILLMDKDFAKQLDSVLFIKVEADGFDLGDQRRPIEANDLPQALDIIRFFKADTPSFSLNTKMARLVKKSKLAEGEDYNLSIDRYQDIEVYYGKWPLVKLSQVAKIDWGNTNLTKSSYVENGPFLGVSAAGCDGRVDHYEHKVGVTVLSAIGNCGKVYFPKENFTAIKNTITFTPNEAVDPKFLFFIMTNNNLPQRGGSQPFITKGDVEKYEIPLPPIEVQQEIVAEIESYQKVIDGARQVVENYKPIIPIDHSWPFISLEDIANIYQPKTITSKEITENGLYKVFGANGVIGFYDNYNHEDEEVLITCRGATCGNVNMSEPYSWITGNAMVVSPKDRNVLSKAYLYYILREFNFTTVISGSAQPQITRSNLSKVKIPLPPIEVQQEIVAEIESIQELVYNNKILICRLEEKINHCIRAVWEGT